MVRIALITGLVTLPKVVILVAVVRTGHEFFVRRGTSDKLDEVLRDIKSYLSLCMNETGIVLASCLRRQGRQIRHGSAPIWSERAVCGATVALVPVRLSNGNLSHDGASSSDGATGGDCVWSGRQGIHAFRNAAQVILIVFNVWPGISNAAPASIFNHPTIT